MIESIFAKILGARGSELILVFLSEVSLEKCLKTLNINSY